MHTIQTDTHSHIILYSGKRLPDKIFANMASKLKMDKIFADAGHHSR